MDSREKAIKIIADLSGIHSAEHREMLEEAVLQTIRIEELQGLRGVVLEEDRLAMLAAYAHKLNRRRKRFRIALSAAFLLCLLGLAGGVFYFKESKAQWEAEQLERKEEILMTQERLDSLNQAYAGMVKTMKQEKKKAHWAKAKVEAAKRSQAQEFKEAQAHNWGLMAEDLLQQRDAKNALKLASLAYGASGRRPPISVAKTLCQAYFYNEEVHFERIARHEAAVRHIATAPNSHYFATASNDHTAKIWTEDGRPVATLSGHERAVLSVSFSPNSKLLATGSEDETAIVWGTDGAIKAKLQGHRDDVRKAVFSPDGRLIATVSFDQTAKIWTLQGKLLHTLEGHGNALDQVAFSPNGNYLATGSWDKTCRIWEVRTGKLKSVLEGHEGRINSLCFSPSGKELLSGSEDGKAILWNLEGDQVQTFALHTDAVKMAVFSPNGRRVLTSSEDKTGIIWNRNGIPAQRLSGHAFGLVGAVYSRYGRYILTAATDNVVRLWSSDGELIQEYIGHQEQITSLAFMPSRRRIVTAGYDKTAKVWLAPKGIHLWVKNTDELPEFSEEQRKAYGID